jgi:drug/metabolite transporter (DMT)-like permease
VLLGYYVFAETPDVWTIAGSIVIVASATYIAHREARLSREGRR